MVATYESLVCTKTAAAKLSGFYHSDIESIVVFENSILVVNNRGHKKSIAKNKFFGEFVKNRRARAEGLIAIQTEDHPCVFEVSSGSGNGHYEVMLSRYGVSCNCVDHKNQLVVFGDGACKHSYRVLFDLGYERLSEYRQAWEKPGMTLEKIITQKTKIAEKVELEVA